MTPSSGKNKKKACESYEEIYPGYEFIDSSLPIIRITSRAAGIGGKQRYIDGFVHPAFAGGHGNGNSGIFQQRAFARL
ncbi:hypothetical protein I4300191C4_00900 [Solibaculum mannosilyticum]